MSLSKKGYYQGGGGINEPTPGKKKYESDPAIVVQPRFKEPFYRNYDLYTIPGMEHVGPGTGYHGLQNYKSVEEFLKDRRARLRPRYVADDSWQIDNGERIKKNPDRKARMVIFERIVKQARISDDNDIDFPIDDMINHDNIIYPIEDEYQIRREKGDRYQFPSDGSSLDPENLNISMTSPQIAGEHSYLPEADFADRSDEALNFGRDYDNEAEMPTGDKLKDLEEKYLEPSETDLFGLPDGIDPISDLDSEQTKQIENPFTGISDISEQMYEDKWNI